MEIDLNNLPDEANYVWRLTATTFLMKTIRREKVGVGDSGSKSNTLFFFFFFFLLLFHTWGWDPSDTTALGVVFTPMARNSIPE